MYKSTETCDHMCLDVTARIIAQHAYGHKAHYSNHVEKEMNFFEVNFVTVSWLLIAKPLAQFIPRRQCNLKK